MDPFEATPTMVAEPAQVTLRSVGCKTAVAQDPGTLVAKEKTALVTTACPTCKRTPVADVNAIGCLHWGRKLFVCSALHGHDASCAWCAKDLIVPSGSEQEALEASGKAFKWLVFR